MCQTFNPAAFTFAVGEHAQPGGPVYRTALAGETHTCTRVLLNIDQHIAQHMAQYTANKSAQYIEVHAFLALSELLLVLKSAVSHYVKTHIHTQTQRPKFDAF